MTLDIKHGSEKHGVKRGDTPTSENLPEVPNGAQILPELPYVFEAPE
jgi:hypothetical protein